MMSLVCYCGLLTSLQGTSFSSQQRIQLWMLDGLNFTLFCLMRFFNFQYREHTATSSCSTFCLIKGGLRNKSLLLQCIMLLLLLLFSSRLFNRGKHRRSFSFLKHVRRYDVAVFQTGQIIGLCQAKKQLRKSSTTKTWLRMTPHVIKTWGKN